VVREGGIKLLGGKRQRIAIVRAFLKNSKILLLNEATSAIDNITEKLIRESLKT
jgi:ABC-type multidrug transport system fused ATPase/permease subunit